MRKKILKNAFIRNIFYAFGAQGISMILSILMSLFLPKIMGVNDYSYWQLFVFYISYAGFFHLGLNDGMYLKQGGKNYENLNYSLLNTNLILITAFQIIIIFIGCILLRVSGLADTNRVFVMICTMIYMIIYNYTGFLAYVLQIANKIKEYSISVTIEKVIFLIIVVMSIMTNKIFFSLYIVLNIFAKLCALIYEVVKCKEIVFATPQFSKENVNDFFDNIRVGINITTSSVAGMLVLGIGRNFIDARWGLETFGKFSFAISLSNFMLQFMSQVSLVLFPTLKRVDKNKMTSYYHVLQDILSFVLLGILLFYMPLYYILRIWLPQYTESMKYMVILLPICVFDGKMNMLCNTYLKVLRKERQLLYFNFIALFISAGLCAIGTYIFKNVFIVANSMVIAVAVRYIISKIYLDGLFHKIIIPDIFVDCLMCIIFVLGTWFTSPLYGFGIYCVAYLILCIIKKNKIISLLRLMRGRI